MLLWAYARARSFRNARLSSISSSHASTAVLESYYLRSSLQDLGLRFNWGAVKELELSYYDGEAPLFLLHSLILVIKFKV